MPVPAVDADKRGDAYKKVKPVEGIDEQGLVPDPQVMHVLFARLMAVLGPLGILPIIFAVNSVAPSALLHLYSPFDGSSEAIFCTSLKTAPEPPSGPEPAPVHI